MLKYYVKTAIRNFRKNKLFTLINLFGLSMGMTSAIMIMIWVQNERSFGTNYPGHDHIYRVTSNLTKSKWVWESSPLLLAEAVKKQLPEVDMAARLCPRGWTLTLNVKNHQFAEKNAAYIDSTWFSLFKYKFVQGSPSDFNSMLFSVILTESKAKKLFGTTNAIGKTIRIDTIDYKVQGVIENNPANSVFQYDVLIGLQAYLSNPQVLANDMSWGNFNYITFLKLKDQVVKSVVENKITRLAKEKRGDNDFTFNLTALKDLHFESDISSGSSLPRVQKGTVDLFSLLAVILIVIACINYVNLTTGKASLRAKEVSIKKIVGAGRLALFMQFVIDSFVITISALAVSLILIYLLLPVFSSLTDRHFENVLLSIRVWKIFIFIIPLIVILNGIYPAVLLSSFKPLNVLSGRTVLKIKDATLRKSLVVLQFTLSLALIIGTIVIFKQLDYIQKRNVGYDRSQVFSFSIPYKSFKGLKTDAVMARLQGIKGELANETSIAGITLASQSIVQLTSSNSGSANWDGRDPGFVPTVFQLSADPDYAGVMGLQMKAGRWFEKNSITDQHNFILNETAANEFGIHKPVIGQRFIFQRDTGRIIGLVKDFNFQSIHEKIKPLVLLNNPAWRYNFFVKAVAGKTAAALDKVHKMWGRYANDEAFEYAFLDEHFDRLYKADHTVSLIILAFSIIAIAISALGLLGLSSFAIDQRIKEIGIRKVLGASVNNILALLSADFVRLILIAMFISFPLGWWAMSKWLDNFAYRISINWYIFALSGIIAVLVVLLTVSSQALKAAMGNPVKSLRNE